MTSRDLAQRALWAATFLAGALILCLAALINGGPILFPDTLSYLLDGQSLVRLNWPGNERPVFYGLAIWFLHWERSVWPVMAAQGLVVVHLIWLTLRVLGVAQSRLRLLGIVAFLAIATPLSWYVSHILPDVFTGVLILAMFLLGFCRNRLTRGEMAYLFLLATASVCFHLSHLVVALTIAGAGYLAWVAARDRRATIQPGLLLGPIALALAVYFSFSLIVYRQVTLTPKSPPFLLARMIADGPGRDYLVASCGRTPYVICKYMDHLPDTENGILWQFLAPMRNTPDFWAIRAEQGPIVAATALMFPGRVVSNMLAGTTRQLVTISAATEFNDTDQRTMERLYAFVSRDFADTLQGRGLLTDPNLEGINSLHATVAIASLPLCILFALACLRSCNRQAALLVGIVLLGLLANAFATGALAGVFGRYQGRAIWLLPFAALVASLVFARGRTALPRSLVRGSVGDQP